MAFDLCDSEPTVHTIATIIRCMNMRMNSNELAPMSTDLCGFDADFTFAPAPLPFAGVLPAWWHRLTSSREPPLPPIAPELRLPFADTEATWCPR